MLQRHLIHLGIVWPYQATYDFLSDPLNYPTWAAVKASTFRQVEGLVWAADTEFGPRRVLFCERNPYGVLDHAVYREGDDPVVMPMRVIPNADGCDLTFMYFRRPGMSEPEFRSAVEWVTTDFMILKTLLESAGTIALRPDLN